ncbi:MAG: TlpA family protein disulfide reductase [Candidatus Velamenicoccus archaeovorus]
MGRRVFLGVLVSLALVSATGCTGDVQDAVGTAVVEVSGAMPTLSGTTLQGSELSPADYRGRVVVVNFWATWCGPCRREQPVLSAAQEEAGPDGPVFLGVNYRDDPAAARAYLEEFDVAYPSMPDRSGALAYRFGVPGLPSTIFVDAAGRMRYRVVGALTASELSDLLGRLTSG